MATLADELLADFGSDDEGEQQQEDQPQDGAHGNPSSKRKASDPDYDDDLDDLMGDADEEVDGGHNDQEMGEGDEQEQKDLKLGKNAVKPTEEMDQDQVEQMDLKKEKSVKNVSKLMNSSKMKEVMVAIDVYGTQPEPDVEGVLEESPEYQLIVRSNNLAVDVDNEIMVVHKFIRDHYSPRFPELETLILNPWEFVQAVKALGNEEDMSKAKLEGILPHGTVVVISMTASTTRGKALAEDEWERVTEACDLVYDLESARRKILQYVESRMSFIAPNLSAVVGTRVATKILGVAGGLTGLSKIPACNVHLLGASKKIATGFSTAFSGRHNGFIFQSDLVQNVSEDYHRQAQRIVAAKALLTARVDANASARDGSYGRKIREELEKKLEKLQEPPPAKMTKALPVPKEGGKKNRRGGRRARKAKEAAGMTELRKMQNRLEFGKEEEEAGAFDETRGLGMINSNASGKIRAAAAESRGKAKMSKKNQNRLANLKAASSSSSYSGGGESSGTASSLSFTPIQGIELVDPSRQKKVDDANAKWFQEGQFSLLPGAFKGTPLPGSNLGAPVSSSSSPSTFGSMGPPSLPSKKK